ncbi:uncharacterized protein RJT21DRAFT_117159 [Scheffersomyces amazonensis]|uniref:uncharacterized protein n=1 Tax=Scheffersomyces amazonensis TaxID=1078765 RepID=UPI00315CA03F
MNDELHIQINDYDTYQCPPTPLDHLYHKVSQVPIIRIYGSLSVPSTTSSSTKRSSLHRDSFNVLLHVHNYYPYIYVDCHDTNYSKLSSTQYLDEVAQYLENSLRESFRRAKGKGKDRDNDDIDDIDDNYPDDADEITDKMSTSTRRFIAKVSIVKGTPIYGFQLGYRIFYKISLLSPKYKTRLNKLIYDKVVDFNKFLNGKSKKQHLIYEGHIPFLLQFLTDFNLFGCGWLYVNNTPGLYFRDPILLALNKRHYTSSQISNLVRYLTPFIHPYNVLLHERMGKSIMEIDITTQIIGNRHSIKVRDLHSTFHELITFNHHIKSLESTSGGYKFDEFGNPRIYLSSLKHVYDDLRYQYNLRNPNSSTDSSFWSDTQKRTDKIDNFYLGMGSTDWSNQSELMELLKYIVKLNGSTNITPELYGKRHFIHQPSIVDHISKDNVVTIDQIRTTFDEIDYEISQGTGHKLLLNDDLRAWTSDEYSKLFLNKDEEENGNGNGDGNIHGSLELSGNTVDPGKAADLQEINNDISSSDPFSSDDELDFVVPQEEAEESEEPQVNATQLKEVDEEILMALTQKRNTRRSQSQVTNVSFSFNEITSISTSTTSQSPSMLRMLAGRSYFEVPVPDELQPSRIDETFDELGLPKINYKDPFYDNEADMPSRPLIFANKKIVVPLVTEDTVPTMAISQYIRDQLDSEPQRESVSESSTSVWEYVVPPPSKAHVKDWLAHSRAQTKAKSIKFRSQIELKSESEDYKFSYNSEKVERDDDGFNKLTNLLVEVHVNTATDKFPNPQTNPVTLVMYTFDDANEMLRHCELKSGILIVGSGSGSASTSTSTSVEWLKLAQQLDIHSHIEVFDDEKSMVSRLVQLVEILDPDILSGYEVNASSWGYLIERFRTVYDINLLVSLSRGKHQSNGKFGDRWGYTHTSNIKISGRHTMNVWRTLRHEMSLTNYSLENVSYHLLHQSLARYSNLQLSNWLTSPRWAPKLQVLHYYSRRISLTLKIIDVLEVITRNVEHSRLIGIDFNSNFYRGSQFKIESILCRITKSENLLLNSPSKQQVHEMRPIECIPLIMEPESNFYKSPMVVLDFQSLYPSIMIAYNYCFSTLIGKLHNFKPSKNNIGYLKNLNLSPGLVDLLIKQQGITLSPNGFMFVKSNVRKSILAKMLEEILSSRVMVKTIMKEFKDDAELTRLYNARQLALKLIANVTYGYTSATFSGRMPNPDVSDAIVSTGREILTKSIELIENNDFGAKVVYGDTDSLFVYFPGKSKAEAFSIGRKIAEFITESFPDPIKLKFEKVYHPCILLTKKRYVGYMYEDEDQIIPKFDAKGIETVRRDGIPAQSKIVEKSLRILFDTKNLSQVKSYVMTQFQKIISNKISINDFCFAKEVRYGTYKNEKYLPPGAIVAARKVEQDPRQEPQYRERIPYVVIQDSSKPRIKDRCMSPEDFMATYSTTQPLSLDYEYYITRVLIPPLERIFNLIGVDVKGWYRQLPRGSRIGGGGGGGTSTSKREPSMTPEMAMELKWNEINRVNLQSVCQQCVSRNFGVSGLTMVHESTNHCINNNCQVYYNKFKRTVEFDW